MDWRFNTIWFEQIDANKKLTWDFKGQKKELINLQNIEYATLWYYKQKSDSFDSLPQSKMLLYLELNSANFKNLSGIEKFNNLKRLELHYCIKLESDAGLANINNSIEFLHINQSKKLRSIDEISKLSKLKSLRLNSCGSLENLNFLKYLPSLIDFRFVDTNVLDGDLTPIIEHPTLRSVGFLNKRHYNLSEKEVDLHLSSKSNEEYKEYIYKDKYKTFSYK